LRLRDPGLVRVRVPRESGRTHQRGWTSDGRTSLFGSRLSREAGRVTLLPPRRQAFLGVLEVAQRSSGGFSGNANTRCTRAPRAARLEITKDQLLRRVPSGFDSVRLPEGKHPSTTAPAIHFTHLTHFVRRSRSLLCRLAVGLIAIALTDIDIWLLPASPLLARSLPRLLL
jgi:hypothetical protein